MRAGCFWCGFQAVAGDFGDLGVPCGDGGGKQRRRGKDKAGRGRCPRMLAREVMLLNEHNAEKCALLEG